MQELTTKQEMFVQELVKGKSQRQAYISAGYSTDGKSDEYIDTKASELFANGKVSSRYYEIIEESKEKALWTREEAVKDLMQLKALGLENAKKDEDGNIVISPKVADIALKAIKELNSMYGYNEQKVDVTTDNELQINISVV